MAFGQQQGPPAPAKQVAELLRLVQDLGHLDFRDARGPLGLTQRQAAGRFTRDEATALMEQLQPGSEAPPPGTTARLSADERAARGLPDGVLAAELQRRGWIVVEP
jgi:hypothetical protein